VSLYAELKRRNVIRMAGLYLVGAWLLIQIAETLLPIFHTPDWVLQVLVVLLALGLVPALVFSWIYELTPEGLKRDAEVDPAHSIAPRTAQRMDRLMGLGLLAVVAIVIADRFWPASAPRDDAITQPSAGAPADPMADSAAPVAASTAPEKSIAVLPFTDLSPNRDHEYFSDGMAEEILNALAQVKDLKVAGRTSSFHFKGKDQDLRSIGQSLGVSNVLEGSVRKQGEQVRITAQLIQVSDGFHLWSQTYDGDLRDVFELQERIARAITDELEVILNGDQQQRLTRQGTDNVLAHQQYLRGRYFWNRRGYLNLKSAEQAFQAALAADPEYVDAWAGLAQTQALIFEYSVNDPDSPGRVDTSDQALDAAEHALRLDPHHSAALSVRAVVRGQYQFDWVAAEKDFRAAIASNPRDATALHWYGELLMYQRRWEEAGAQLDAAIAIDPLAPVLHLAKAHSLAFRGELEAALPIYEEALRLLPDMYVALKAKAFALLQLGRFDEAARVAGQMSGSEGQAMQALAAAMNDPTLTEQTVAILQADGPGGVSGRARMLLMLGRHDLALDQLERLFAEGDPLNAYLYCLTPFDALSSDPRYQALLGQLGLPLPGVTP
jgi:TolB-like protein/Tfp pilus assembly protein PilF